VRERFAALAFRCSAAGDHARVIDVAEAHALVLRAVDVARGHWHEGVARCPVGPPRQCPRRPRSSKTLHPIRMKENKLKKKCRKQRKKKKKKIKLGLGGTVWHGRNEDAIEARHPIALTIAAGTCRHPTSRGLGPPITYRLSWPGALILGRRLAELRASSPRLHEAAGATVMGTRRALGRSAGTACSAV